MTPKQLVVIGLCFLVNVIDGYDLVSVAVIAPKLAPLWHIQPNLLGLLLACGPLGMAFGSIFLAPLADVYGRRRGILVCLAVMTLGTLCAAATQNFMMLGACRIFAGLGMGAAIALAYTIGGENAPAKGRAFAISLVGSGMVVGGACGNLIAIPLLRDYGWQTVFLFGGAASLVLMPLVFLIIDPMPAGTPAPAHRKSPYSEVLRGPMGLTTLFVCLGFATVVTVSAFLSQWMPKILVDAGLPLAVSLGLAGLQAIGSMVGTLSMGLMGAVADVRKLGIFTSLAGVGVAIVFAMTPADPKLLAPLIFVMGFMITGSITAVFAAIPLVMPSHVRATATGLAVGIGRFGMVGGPIFAGLLIQSGMHRSQFLVLGVLPLLLSTLAFVALGRKGRDIPQT